MLRILFTVVLVAGLSGFWLSAVQAGDIACRQPLTEESGTAIEVVDFCFSPAVLHIETGSVVTWTNLDSVQHNIVAVGADWSDKRLISEGETTSAGFNQAGVFPYFCSLHRGMVGVVVVGGDGGEGASLLASPDQAGGARSWLSLSVALLAGSGLAIAAVAGGGTLFWRRRS